MPTRNGNKTIGQVIKQARVKLHMTADEVAELCEVSRSRVYMWEAEKYVLPKNLRRLSAALHVSVRRLKAVNREPR